MSSSNTDTNQSSDELTEDQRFAIATVAGVPFHIDYDWRSGKMKLTSEPCAITELNGQYVVFHRPPRR